MNHASRRTKQQFTTPYKSQAAAKEPWSVAASAQLSRPTSAGGLRSAQAEWYGCAWPTARDGRIRQANAATSASDGSAMSWIAPALTGFRQGRRCIQC